MAGQAKKCVERYCELANKTTQQLHEVSTPCIDDHHFKEEELQSVGELLEVCSQFVLKCLYLACDERLSLVRSLTFIIHVTANNIVMWMQIGTVSRLRFILQEIFRIQIYVGWNVVRFSKPYVCSSQLDV